MWDLWSRKWHWDRFFSESFTFPVSIILPVWHTSPCLSSIPISRTSGWSQRTFTKSNVVLDIREHWAQKYFHIVFYSFSPSSAGLKGQAGKGQSIAHASPTIFSPFQKHCHVTCRSLQLLLNNWPKWSVRKF